MAYKVAAALFVAALLAGCQHETADRLPLPSLEGPHVAAGGAEPQAKGPKVTDPPESDTRTKTPAVPDDWIPRAAANNWQWIVIHHSATPAGSAATFDMAHRRKGWDELAYHFVIGNGTGSRDGQIEVGPRWPKQKWGAHTKTADNRYNDYGIGICLVGNFEIDRPTAAQVNALAKLTAYLMQKYHIPASRVIGHSDAKPTECPGRNLSVAGIRRMASGLAMAGVPALQAAAGPARRDATSATSR